MIAKHRTVTIHGFALCMFSKPLVNGTLIIICWCTIATCDICIDNINLHELIFFQNKMTLYIVGTVCYLSKRSYMCLLLGKTFPN